MNILDELESLAGDSLYDVDRDAVGSFGYLTKRGELAERALPALIRVARAADWLTRGGKALEDCRHEVNSMEFEALEEALRQLRASGEDDEGTRDLSQDDLGAERSEGGW